MRTLQTAVLAMLVSATATVAHADVAAAQKYLTEANDLADKGSMFFEDAGAKLELAEASLDDADPAAEKAKVTEGIATLKSKLSAGADAEKKAIVTRKLDRALKEAEESIGNLIT